MKDGDGLIVDAMNNLPNQEILEAIGHAVNLQDKNFRIIYQNTMAKKIMGNQRGELCYQAFEHKAGVCDKCPMVLSFQDGKVHRVERPSQCRKGMVVEITSSVIRDSEGEIIAGLEVVRDITRFRKMEEEQEKMLRELKEALKKVKTPRGLLPICVSCNKVRDDDNNWTKVDVYIRDHSEAELTHGYCPDCMRNQFSIEDETVPER